MTWNSEQNIRKRDLPSLLPSSRTGGSSLGITPGGTPMRIFTPMTKLFRVSASTRGSFGDAPSRISNGLTPSVLFNSSSRLIWVVAFPLFESCGGYISSRSILLISHEEFCHVSPFGNTHREIANEVDWLVTFPEIFQQARVNAGLSSGDHEIISVS